MDNTKYRENLPILKHFEADSIKSNIDSFRKGEWTLFNIFKFAALGAVGYLTWVYVLPPLFIALGKVIAVAGSLILAVGLIIAAPVILKAIRRFTRFVHKSVIKHDPFGELEEQKGKMQANKKKFREAQGKIKKLKHDMEVEANQSEKNAKALQTKITSLESKAREINTKIDNGVKTNPQFKTTNEYVELYAERQKTLSDAQRKMHMYEQEKTFISKYGTRGAIMNKFSQKLTLVGTAMDIKILDFEATIDILKRDYDFAQKSREATESAKSAMLFTEGWEVEYALDVVTSTIAEDIAITAGNLNDIDMLTSTYSMDSDELFANLESLTLRIGTGEEAVTDSKQYINPEYKMTHEDKINSGGFGNMEF
jgi:hypothetical protein